MPEAIPTITIHDTVRLRAGGPAMNPTAFETDTQGRPTVTCTWFVHGIQHHGTFLLASVDKVKPGLVSAQIVRT
jgi:uncharacterized protein YodC (DUF2158 family)